MTRCAPLAQISDITERVAKTNDDEFDALIRRKFLLETIVR